MAVTQQVARLPDAFVTRCSQDLRVFEEVLRFEALDEVDYLDLDWAPSLLEKASVLNGLPHHLHEALCLSTSGLLEVKPGYTGPYSYYQTPTYLGSRDVADVSGALRQIQVDTLLTDEVAASLLSDPGWANPLSYLVKHFLALRSFYAGAAERGLALMMWWD